MRLHITTFLLLLCVLANAQSTKQSRYADSLYKAKDWLNAASAYQAAAESLALFQNPKTVLYNAACSYALGGENGKALTTLEKAVYQHGYRNLDHMKKDSDLLPLHKDKRWKAMLTHLEKQRRLMKNPRNARVVTSDIHNFWTAYDLAQKDTANRESIFIKNYFEKASPGLQDYFTSKIGSVSYFMSNQRVKPKFYAAIRENTLAVDKLKDSMYMYFDKLKTWYDDAVFPDMYFVIGRWNSAGTVSDAGLLLGVDQIARTPDIPQQELNLWEKNNFNDFTELPTIAMHEQIHFQQSKIKGDTTLLSNALIEGMADFICELITGRNPSKRQHEFAATRKKEIWERFKKEMYLQRAYNWIANANQETPGHPADLGYYVGYEICKAYFDKAKNKKKAIKEMLEIQDAKAFLEKSGYDEMMSK